MDRKQHSSDPAVWVFPKAPLKMGVQTKEWASIWERYYTQGKKRGCLELSNWSWAMGQSLGMRRWSGLYIWVPEAQDSYAGWMLLTRLVLSCCTGGLIQSLCMLHEPPTMELYS